MPSPDYLLALCFVKKLKKKICQAQVYRLAEHFLKRAGVPGVNRTAEVELAVADAVNIEKEACQRSKSKLVYVNLCSQHTMPSKAPKVEAVDLTATPAEEVTDGGVEETLRLAGLLSDSPPNSPPRLTKCNGEEDDPALAREEDPGRAISSSDPPPGSDLKDGASGGPSDARCSDKSDPNTEDLGSESKSALSTNGCEGLINSSGAGDGTELCGSRAPEPGSSVSPKHLHDDDAPCLLEMDPLGGERGEEPSPPGSEIELPGKTPDSTGMEAAPGREAAVSGGCHRESCSEKDPSTSRSSAPTMGRESTRRGSSSSHSLQTEPTATEELGTDAAGDNLPASGDSVSKKVCRRRFLVPSILSPSGRLHSGSPLQVEAYIKEHVRPLCKSGVITVEQYRWAVGKAADKVMKFHSKAKSASFLIKEGDKVKKLAEEYVAASQRKEWKPRPPAQGV